MKKRELTKSAIKIIKRIKENGFTAFFAGGAVRDQILGISTISDIDIATSATPDEIEEIFTNTHPVGKSFGVMIVVMDREPFEVATFREDGGYQNGRHPESIKFSNAKEDSYRRDFTINGLFYDPIEDKVLDFVGGIDDLNRKVIRTIGDPNDRFNEDYLRLLRAIRFSARFSFPIEESSWKAIKNLSFNIKKISFERIYQELTKMLTDRDPATAIRLLQESGLLKYTLPEVDRMVGVEQPKEYHPEGDVFEHTLMVIKNLGEYPSAVLGWSALLHDVGKPDTQTFSDRIRFNNHHSVGGRIARDILFRLKAPKRLTEDIVACVENHMHFINVQNMRVAKLKKFLSRDTIDTELLLHKADCSASHGDISNYYFLKDKQVEFMSEGIKPEPFILGRDLIAAGLKPSRDFRTILDNAYVLQLEDVLKNREDALEWLERYLEK